MSLISDSLFITNQKYLVSSSIKLFPVDYKRVLMEIRKKTWPKFFEKIMSGEKTFEFRLADTDYKVGDVLVLREWDPEKNEYTGREIKKTITYVALTKNTRYLDRDCENRDHCQY